MKSARFFKSNHLLQGVAAVSIGGLFIAAGFVLGGEVRPFAAPAQTAAEFGGVERYLIHVSTDKPIYRSGERLYVRGVLLRADGHTPLASSLSETVSFEIKGPKGDTVASGVSSIIDSVAGFSWDIPPTQAGGEYTVRISHPGADGRAERKFDIRAYRAPRLKSQIVFVRDGYGTGDTVAANLHVERAEGGIPAGAKVSVSARVDGEETWKGTTTVDSSGNASASFRLPAAIARGEGVMAMIIEDGGTVETATKTIPILLQTLDLAVYPEGGDLIAGLPNRVYVEGRTPARKPADMAGVVVNTAGREVATFRTEHEGRSRFSFVPAKGEAYSLRITEPAGIKTVFALPAVKASGVVISSASDVTPRLKDVVVRVGATSDGSYLIALSQRGREFAVKPVTLRANQPADFTFAVPRSLDGVIVATVYDDHMSPLAERLIFRQPEHKLKVQVVPDRTDYVPGDKVTLRVKTIDDTGKPVSAMVGLTVTDSSVLEMIEKREQTPSLPVMVLLENEVQNLADAHVYLDESNPKAPLATDLLLGTQGWRRFATAGTGSLNGSVTNASNARIPGVTVRAMNTATGEVLTAVTNENGAYAFSNVKAGTYRISASLPGFQTMTAGSQVAHDRFVKQDFRLAVAVNADMFFGAAAAEGRRGQQQGQQGRFVPPPAAPAVVAGNRVRDLPLNGRGVFDRFEVLQAPKDAYKNVQVQQLPGQGGGVAFGIGQGRAVARDEAFMRADIGRANIVTVREYAHTLRPNWTEGSRVDFAET